MYIGVCHLSVVPLRAADSHRSEMVSQVLFAEAFDIIQENKEWAYIRMLDNRYEGWLQQGQFVRFPEDMRHRLSEGTYRLVDREGGIARWRDRVITLLHGTKVPWQLAEQDRDVFPYELEATYRVPVQADFQTELPKLIAHYRDSPYLWGGRTRYGIDCSGLSQVLMAHFGISLPRDAYQQAELGELVKDLSALRAGDLAFFDNDAGKITHVGMMIDAETILHASACVRIDKMDRAGIFNADQNSYTHRLRIVKRFLYI